MTATTHGSSTVREWKLRYPLGHAVETVLDRIADAGKGQQTARHALVIMRELFSEAVENKNIGQNPTRRAELPLNCKASKETQPLTVEQVYRLFEQTSGRDYMMWGVMVMCGLRIGECIALKKSGVLLQGLQVDDFGLKGKPAPTKRRKPPNRTIVGASSRAGELGRAG